MAAADLTRWFLALFFSGVAAFYMVRIIFVKHRMGTSPVFAGESVTLHWATHAAFRVFRALIFGVCLVRLVWSDFDYFLITFDLLWHPLVLIAGCGLLLASFSAAIAIHFYMGENWRSGTRVGDQTRLITTGPFSLSRNPMMLCVMVAQIGLFLALPSLFTLICLVIGVWAVIAQVGIEEQILRERFGTEYDIYMEHTPRWLNFPLIHA